MATGGSIIEYAWNGRTFSVAADSDSTRDLGGKSSEHQPNGDGTARVIQTRKIWQVTGINTEFDEDRGDQEFLQDGADAGIDRPFTITYASGVTYEGVGLPTGDIQGSSQSATGTINFTGPGKLRKQ